MSAGDITEKSGWLGRMRAGLARSSEKFGQSLGFLSGGRIEAEDLDSVEEALIAADLGPRVAGRIVARLAEARLSGEVDMERVRAIAADEITAILAPLAKPLLVTAFPRPHTILVVGVNGTGKTTTIAKLAHNFQEDDYAVLLAAGDTFRAAAVEQLRIWGERLGIPVISGKPDADLMDELAKVRRVLGRQAPGAPHDTILVLDATTGQNALSQIEIFREVAGVTGLVMTKLDGTARGGVLVAAAEQFALPIHAIGVGEQLGDLRPFEARAFADALVGAGG